ncbi:MAG: hypothetical protein U5Q03_04785 [Bacteroidota bacterium]|nr:hypothetical protein [Bacteroidota bacterium]
MKQLLFILLLINSNLLFSQNANDEILGSWAFVKSESIDSDHIHLFGNEIIFKITKDSLFSAHIFYEEVDSYPYTIIDSTIVLNDSTKFDIHFVSKDSLKLIFKNNRIITLLKTSILSTR